IRGMSARAFSLADELPVLEDETSIEIAPSDTRFRLELSVRPDGPMAYYQVDVDASGTRETDGALSESGLLFTGSGYGMVEDQASEAYVEVFLEDVVPLVTIEELSDGALVSWSRVSGAESYRVREVRSGGTSDSLTTALSLFVPFDPGLEARSYRVQSVLVDGRASAFGEERSVGFEAGFGQLELTVVDARTSLPLSGASVQLGDASTTTNEAGFARLDGLPAGVQTLFVTLEGYLSASRNVTITAGTTTPVTVALSPPAVGGYRIVLTWGEVPFDLDAHLRTPLIDGVSYEVYYAFLGSETEAPFAQLDADDTESFGPETVTIAQSLAGTYSYFVYNYSEDPAIAGSGAQVELY
ncbi:MAG: carboxypeptidase regulatory-like domain-containing protein, partial [Candidatus Eisenbacteria bacterium]|nr:carboxypeptidase regulatory-like domain-containing protein [Candidatus Eisenbacteria bacterium]